MNEIVKLLNYFFGYFSPERKLERLKLKRDQLEREIAEIKKKEPTEELAWRLVELQKKVEVLNVHIRYLEKPNAN